MCHRPVTRLRPQSKASSERGYPTPMLRELRARSPAQARHLSLRDLHCSRSSERHALHALRCLPCSKVTIIKNYRHFTKRTANPYGARLCAVFSKRADSIASRRSQGRSQIRSGENHAPRARDSFPRERARGTRKSPWGFPQGLCERDLASFSSRGTLRAELASGLRRTRFPGVHRGSYRREPGRSPHTLRARPLALARGARELATACGPSLRSLLGRLACEARFAAGLDNGEHLAHLRVALVCARGGRAHLRAHGEETCAGCMRSANPLVLHPSVLIAWTYPSGVTLCMRTACSYMWDHTVSPMLPASV